MADSSLSRFDSSALLKEEYVALRAEICQSIAQQHRILLSGYAAAATAFGIVIGSTAIGPKALFVVPLVLLAMVALWAVECNRMVRASYYIGYVLWPELCKVAGRTAETGWESWIRIQSGDEGWFRRRQHLFQQMVVVYVPFALSVAATAVAGAAAWGDGEWIFPISGFAVFSLIVWCIVYVNVRRISDLGAINCTK
jgi:hypothetical protein